MKNCVDRYLQRASYIAQIFLVVIAIWGYYYTVLPTYQYSSLQESIAKKEQDLKDLQKNIDGLYITLKNELINKFVIRVMLECSPGISLIMQDSSVEEKEQNIKPPLSDNPYNCLRKKVESDATLTNLRSTDIQELIATIESLEKIITDKYDEVVKQSKDEDFLENLGKKNSPYTKKIRNVIPEDDTYRDIYKQTYISIGTTSLISDFSNDFNKIVNDQIKKPKIDY